MRATSRRDFLRLVSLAAGGSALLTGLSVSGLAQPADQSITRLDGSHVAPTEIDKTVERLMKAARVPGMGIAILNHARVVCLRGLGYRDFEQHKPFTEDTVIPGASFTKTVFAFMVMQLVQENMLSLDEPLYQYLPKPLPQYEKYTDLAADDRYKKVTARMALDHTTGFPNWRWLTDEKKLKIYFEPGSRFAYSGEGIALLQLVVEQVTGKNVGELIQARVFDPLQMSRTSMTWQPAFESNYAIGYDEDEKPLGHEQRKRADAAGSMDTTVADFAKFVQTILQRRILNTASWQTMLSPQIAIHSKHEFPTLVSEPTTQNDTIKLSYGLGLGLFESPYGKACFKEGHMDGCENHSSPLTTIKPQSS